METTVIKEIKKKVFVSNEVPEECVKRAQVAIVSELSWHLIAPNPYRAHGLGSAMPLPQVTCPIVDVRSVQDDDAMMKVMAACVDKAAGVIDLVGLLSGLEALGAKVTLSPEAKKKTAADVSAAFREKSKRVASRVRGYRKERVH